MACNDESGFREDVASAVASLVRIYGGPATEAMWDYPGPNVFTMEPGDARAVGFIQGAALARGMTVLELLDDLGIDFND